jgi:hypothetical protein
MFQNAKNSKQQGDIGVGSAIAYFTQLGYTVSLPLTESQSYDLIVDNDDGLKKVQIKTTSHKKNNNYSAMLRTCGGNRSGCGIYKNFDPTKIDLLFILCINGDIYCIPCSKLTNKTYITLGSKYKDYKI